MPQLYYDADGKAKKFCPGCQTTYDEPERHFYKVQTTYHVDGLFTQCKQCRSTYKHNLRKQDPEATKKAEKADYQKRRTYHRTRYDTMYSQDTDYVANKYAVTGRWYKNNPSKASEMTGKRRAYKATTTNGMSISHADYTVILQRDGYWCYICEKPILPNHGLDFDHVIPLSKGGAHIESNIRPTHAVCNRRKKDKLLSEMSEWQRRGP